MELQRNLRYLINRRLDVFCSLGHIVSSEQMDGRSCGGQTASPEVPTLTSTPFSILVSGSDFISQRVNVGAASSSAPPLLILAFF